MTVSFTGIKNVGYLMNGSAENRIYNRVINIQVTNDEKGNDLDEFNKVLEKTKTQNEYHTDTPGLISFFISRQKKGNGISTYDFVLNNNELDINNHKNTDIFVYLWKLTERISQMNESDMVVDDNVYTDDEIYEQTTLGYMAYKLGEAAIINGDETAKKIIKETENMNGTGQEKDEEDKKLDLQGYYVYQAYKPDEAIRGARKIHKTIHHILDCHLR